MYFGGAIGRLTGIRQYQPYLCGVNPGDVDDCEKSNLLRSGIGKHEVSIVK
jgi:hypothetical protein